MIRCVVVDDEPLAVTLLSQFIAQTDGLELLKGFSDALESLDYINAAKVDILFLDIQMPDITGIELLHQLTNKPPAVIFTTAFKDYAIEGYEMGVVDYLLKPFSYSRFQKAVTRAEEFIKPRDIVDSGPAAIFVKAEYKLVKLLLKDIIYIESLDDYIRIHLTESKPVITLMSMKAILEKLPADHFQRVHRKFIISIHTINSIAGKKINLVNNIEIPIGDTYQPIVQSLRNLL